MKKIFALILILICLKGYSQTYNPSIQNPVTNKAVGIALANPTDARSYFYDATNFVYRAYVDTTEVWTYLNQAKYRTGQFPIIVNTGGTLSSGVITGGTNMIWYYKDGTNRNNLVPLLPIITVNGQRSGGIVIGDADSIKARPVDTTFASGSKQGLFLGYDSINHKWKLFQGTSSGGTVTTVTATSPILITGSPTSTPNVAIIDAIADGSTKGASTYTAADFNTVSGLVSLDYVNGQKANGSQPGFLSSADWTTFRNKVTTVNGQTGNAIVKNADSLMNLRIDTTSTGGRNGYVLAFDSVGRKWYLTQNDTSGGGGGSGITQLTGDVTAGPGSGTVAATLANTAVTPGSYTSANITVDSKGRITAAANGSGGSGTPGGSNKDVQFNDSGSFGGESAFSYDKAVNTLSLDSALAKGIKIIGDAVYPDQHQLYINNYSHSTGGYSSLYLGNGPDSTYYGLHLYQLTSDFAGAPNWSVLRSSAGGRLDVADGDLWYTAMGAHGGGQKYVWGFFKNGYLGASPSITIPENGSIPVDHGYKLYVGGSAFLYDRLNIADKGYKYMEIVAKNYLNNPSYVEGVGVKFYGINRTSSEKFIFAVDSVGNLELPGYPSTRGDGYTTKALFTSGTGETGVMKYGHVFDTASGTRNAGQLMYWYGGIPTSDQFLKWDGTTLSTNTLSLSGNAHISTRLTIDDEGYKYANISAGNYLRNPSYVEGVGFRFETIKFGNPAVEAMLIDSTGHLFLPQNQDSATTAVGGCLVRDHATGQIKVGACGTGGGGSDSVIVGDIGADSAYSTFFLRGAHDTLFLRSVTGSNGIKTRYQSDSSLNIYTITRANTLTSDTFNVSSGNGSPANISYTNITSMVGPTIVWVRSGNNIIIDGFANPTTTSSGSTTIDFDLPIPHETIDPYTCGFGQSDRATLISIGQGSTSQKARLTWTAASGASSNISFHIQYRIKP